MTPTASTLEPAGPAAQAAVELWWLMLVLGAAVFVLFAALLGAGLMRRGRGTPVVDDEAEGRVVRRWIVGFGVALPAVVIPVVFVATIVAMRGTPLAAADDALHVEIIGHQFWYEIRYPDLDVVTANELHIPAGRDIAIELISEDVIHSFWVPELAGKLDMLPDHPTTLVLRADEPGEYRGQCAEFCGLQHARMEFLVVATTGSDFDAWVERQTTERPDLAGTHPRGAEVFDSAGCATCHARPGEDSGEGAPALGDLAERRSIAAGTLPNTRDNAAAWIRDPQAIKSGVDMPSARLSDEELGALLDYLGYDR